MLAQHNPDHQLWLYAQKWVDEHKAIIHGYVNKHYFLYYSSYGIEDFIAEAYLVAYELIKTNHYGNFKAFFWRQFKICCATKLANKPHCNKMSAAGECEVAKNEYRHHPDDISAITRALDVLTAKQRQVCRLILFSRRPLSLVELSKALGISRQAVQQRLQQSIKKLEKVNNPFANEY